LAFEDHYFELPLAHRLAFREYGTCLGINCAGETPTGADTQLDSIASDIITMWEKAGIGAAEPPDSAVGAKLQRQGLRPITQVMYAAAILPGAFRRGFLGDLGDKKVVYPPESM